MRSIPGRKKRWYVFPSTIGAWRARSSSGSTRLDRCLRPDGHECGRGHVAVRGAEDAGAGSAVGCRDSERLHGASVDTLAARARAQPVRGEGGAHLEASAHHDRDHDSGPTTRTRASTEEVVMNLEQLRKQAKELLRAAQAGDAEALERLGGREPILARAQLVVAREHGFPSWPALLAASSGVDELVRAAVSGRRDRAERTLALHPELGHDRWVAVVYGRGWDGDPNTAGGPLECPPLVYACHSCFETTRLVRELLDRGADPNGSFRQRVRPHVGALRRGGRQARPRADARAPRGRRRPGRRRVPLPRGVRRAARLRPHPARARRHGDRNQRPWRCGRRRPRRACPPDARRGWRSERGGAGGPCRPPRLRGVDAGAACGAGSRPRPHGRRDVARRCPAANAVPACRAPRAHGCRGVARAARSLDRRRPGGRVGGTARPGRAAAGRSSLVVRRRYAGVRDPDGASRRSRARGSRRRSRLQWRRRRLSRRDAAPPRLLGRERRRRRTTSRAWRRPRPPPRVPTSRRRSTGPSTPRSTTASRDETTSASPSGSSPRARHR